MIENKRLSERERGYVEFRDKEIKKDMRVKTLRWTEIKK